MILTDDQVKTIADKGRALPDAILAPLVLAAVIGAAQDEPAIHASHAQNAPQPKRATSRVYEKSFKHVYAVADYIKANPGARMSGIVKGVSYSRARIRIGVARALQDGLIERRGYGRDTVYFPAAFTTHTDPKPAALLTEQRIDGENRQRVVSVERRRGITSRKANSATRQRIRYVTDFVRRNPGSQIGRIAAALGLSIPQVRYVFRATEREIEMRGERTEARYYPRGYVNGAAPVVSS